MEGGVFFSRVVLTPEHTSHSRQPACKQMAEQARGSDSGDWAGPSDADFAGSGLPFEVPTQMYHQAVHQGLGILQGTTFTCQGMGSNML